MSNNLIEKLKEKKKVMKLSIAALAGAMTVCGGAALCSVSAVKPEGNVEASTAAQAKEDVVQERYNKVQKVIEENYEENDTTIVEKLFEALGDISDEDLASIHAFAKNERNQDVMKYISMMRVTRFLWRSWR